MFLVTETAVTRHKNKNKEKQKNKRKKNETANKHLKKWKTKITEKYDTCHGSLSHNG